MDEPSISTGDAVATKQNGHARPVALAKQPVRFKHLEKLFDAVLDVIDKPLRAFHERIKALERATGLSATPPPPGVQSISPVIANHINARLAPLEKLVSDLDYTAMRYCGIHQSNRTYKRGEAVTIRGGMWLCQETTDTRPGDGDSGWKLVVKSAEPKRGRDDKSAEPA